MFIEQPVGVGFSYASGDNTEELYYNNNDTNSASRNLLAVNRFFELYPEYLSNKFYITGDISLVNVINVINVINVPCLVPE